jgi:5-carboxyvanillate decarboxylase
MRIIAVEEHFSTREFYDYMKSNSGKHRITSNVAALTDVGEGRIAEMNKYEISLQVLSVSQTCAEYLETVHGADWARTCNDELASIVKEKPDRYAGLAALPLENPAAAAEELERAVGKLGLKGAALHSHFRDDYFDDKKYWVIFKKAQDLIVPIYLHPMQPSGAMIKPYLAYPGLERAMAGYGAETHLHALRLILSGLFDEYPYLKIILGHMGEALPFWQWRIENILAKQRNALPHKRKVSEYLKDNFYYSTSGMCSVPSLMCTYMTSGADNLMFAVDYPHELTEPAIKFMEAAPICPAEKEKIYFRCELLPHSF